MPDNTTGFKFSNDPELPSSDATAENLNAAVEKALIYNIGEEAVMPENIHSSVAGAGLGGGAGDPLYVKPDGETIEIQNDQVHLVDGPIIGNSRLKDGAITLDKFADDLKQQFKDIVKTIYKVGDYFITGNSEYPGDRFGGSWKEVEGKLLMSEGEINLPNVSLSQDFSTSMFKGEGWWDGSTGSYIHLDNGKWIWHGTDDPGWGSYHDVYIWVMLSRFDENVKKITVKGNIWWNDNSWDGHDIKLQVWLSNESRFDQDKAKESIKIKEVDPGTRAQNYILNIDEVVDISKLDRTKEVYLTVNVQNGRGSFRSPGRLEVVSLQADLEVFPENIKQLETGKENDFWLPVEVCHIWRKYSDEDDAAPEEDEEEDTPPADAEEDSSDGGAADKGGEGG